jgi:hypothetical protein
MARTVATPAPPAEAVRTAEARCEHCGAPAEKDQLVCLRCGGRIGLDYRRPPGWKLPVAIVIAVALLAAAAFGWALREITNDAKTEVAKAPGGKPSRSGAAKSAPAKPKSKSAAAKKAKAPARPAAARPKAPTGAAAAFHPPGTWPGPRNGFTVMLTSTDNQGSARSTALSAKQSGVPAGYLHSNDYPSLQKGFWYVYGGVYDTRSQAEKAAAGFGKGYPGAFVQWVDGATAARRAAKRNKR